MSKLISIALIDKSPWTDLFDHPTQHIENLAADIQERGIQTPLQVYPRNGRYELLTGHDRLEAAMRIGLREVPCEERSTLTDEDERFRHFVSDNALRKPVWPKAVVEFVLRKHPDWSQRRIAVMANCSVSTVNDVKQYLESVEPQLFAANTIGKDGVVQPAKKPTTPKLRTDKPERVPSAIESTDVSTVETSPVFAVSEEVAEAEPEPVEPDPVQELQHADRRIRELEAELESVTTDDTDQELRRLHSLNTRLNDRLQQLLAEKNAAVNQAERVERMLSKIRAALGVERDRDILPALQGRAA